MRANGISADHQLPVLKHSEATYHPYLPLYLQSNGLDTAATAQSEEDKLLPPGRETGGFRVYLEVRSAKEPSFSQLGWRPLLLGWKFLISVSLQTGKADTVVDCI